MLSVRDGVSIYVNLAPMDMRKGINSLVVFVSEALAHQPQSGDIFLFVNRAKDRAKCLFWDRNGFVLYHKRLEKHRFILPRPDTVEDGLLTLTATQLNGLLAGFDVMLMQQFNELNYQEFI